MAIAEEEEEEGDASVMTLQKQQARTSSMHSRRELGIARLTVIIPQYNTPYLIYFLLTS